MIHDRDFGAPTRVVVDALADAGSQVFVLEYSVESPMSRCLGFPLEYQLPFCKRVLDYFTHFAVKGLVSFTSDIEQEADGEVLQIDGAQLPGAEIYEEGILRDCKRGRPSQLGSALPTTTARLLE